MESPSRERRHVQQRQTGCRIRNPSHKIWLDGEPIAGGESEPLYGETYLPRKFKTALAVPPHNDVDVYTNDLGFVAIADGDRLLGFNVLAGGGMGATHDDVTTFPRLADERFGDFVIRRGLVKPVIDPAEDYHEDV
jgi:sulfite reductase beta subunit-like hemoprotein